MKYITLFSLLIFFAACGSQQQAGQADDQENRSGNRQMKNYDKVAVNTAETGIDLTSYLRRIPGIQITGSGERASIQLRNNASGGAEYRPLFVVDGTPLGYSYSALYQAVDPNEIKSVEVLKTPDETSRYGTRGSAGVIEIRLRGN